MSPIGFSSDTYLTVAHGRHHALVMPDGRGRQALDGALDPHPRRTSDLPVAPGDPFEDRERPLHLAVASDCSMLDGAVLRALTSLGGLPGVEIDLMPGVPDVGASEFGRISWTDQDGGHPVTTSRERDTTHAGYVDADWRRMSREILGGDPDAAERLMLDAAASTALGYDYLVSPRLASQRLVNRRAWPDGVGAVTIAEAFRLAGTKSRMYGFIPMAHDSGIPVSTNLGTVIDMAAVRWVPGLRRALAGATRSADPREEATVQYLLGIRARLNQLLVARDEVYRLARREALSLRRGRPSDAARRPARTGNDLTDLFAYHLTAALDAAYAAGDSLAWVAAARDGHSGSASEVGLRQIGDPRRAISRGRHAQAVSAAVASADRSDFVRASRELRNLNAHRDAVDYGRLAFDPPAPGPEPSVVWVTPLTFGTIGDAGRLHAAVAARADYAEDGLAVLTFTRLVDELWCATSEVISRGIRSMSWSSGSWVKEDPRWNRSSARLWRTGTQRLLWGM